MNYLKKKILIKLGIIKPVKVKAYLDLLKENGLKVGDNFNMMPECIIDYSHCWHIEIGHNVTLAQRVHILAHDASTKMHLNYTKIKNVCIGNNVFIGAGSIIMPGVSIGNNVIIGAGSVITKNISENSVCAGNPAKFICTTDEFLQKQKEQMVKDNTFDESYTLRGNIKPEMKEEMKDSVEKNGSAFVI